MQKWAEMLTSLLHKFRRENIFDSNLCTVPLPVLPRELHQAEKGHVCLLCTYLARSSRKQEDEIKPKQTFASL